MCKRQCRYFVPNLPQIQCSYDDCQISNEIIRLDGTKNGTFLHYKLNKKGIEARKLNLRSSCGKVKREMVKKEKANEASQKHGKVIFEIHVVVIVHSQFSSESVWVF